MVLAALRDIAQQHQAGILAIDLAGVDAGLRQYHRFAGRALVRADQQQVAALAALAEHVQRQQRRGGDQAFQPRARFVIAGVLAKSLRSAGVLHGSSGATINASLAPCQAPTGGSGALVSMDCALTCAVVNRVAASRPAAARAVLRAMISAMALSAASPGGCEACGAEGRVSEVMGEVRELD